MGRRRPKDVKLSAPAAPVEIPPPERLSEEDRARLEVRNLRRQRADEQVGRLRAELALAEQGQAMEHRLFAQLSAELAPKYKLTRGDRIDDVTGEISRAEAQG